jgi:DNA-binding MurR/RpiR family transcriptional regulator
MIEQSDPAGAPIWESLRQRMHEFSPAERKVARVLLTSSPTVGLETVARLASRAGVSGPTVIRFVTRLGFDSYVAFQNAVRDELDARMSSPVRRYARQPMTEATDQLLERHRDFFMQDVQETFDSLSPRELKAAIDMLADTRGRVFLMGGRYSQVLAHQLYLHIQQLRPRTQLLTSDPGERVAACLDAGPRDVLVVFDYRRYQKDVIEFASTLSAAGARMILFTDRWLSPISDFADVVLPSIVESPSPFETLVPALAVVEALVAGMVVAMGGAARKRVEQYAEIADQVVIQLDPPPDSR